MELRRGKQKAVFEQLTNITEEVEVFYYMYYSLYDDIQQTNTFKDFVNKVWFVSLVFGVSRNFSVNRYTVISGFTFTSKPARKNKLEIFRR